MKKIAFALMVLVAACTTSSRDEVEPRTPVADESTTSVRNYRCESGETIAVTYPSTGSARVEYKGRDYDMRIAVSGSGSRYVAGELEWWAKGSGPGSEGTLLRHLADGTSGEALEMCTES